nr:MAG TPA: hypothetical protein [Microviridae sp.]
MAGLFSRLLRFILKSFTHNLIIIKQLTHICVSTVYRSVRFDVKCSFCEL